MRENAPPSPFISFGKSIAADDGINVQANRRLFLEITEACDSRCRLCDYWLRAEPATLPVDYVRETVVPIIERQHIGVTCVTGGEPTLHPFLPEIVRLIRGAGSLVTLITSTSHLQDHFDAVVDNVNAYMLSLDGADSETYRHIRGIALFDQVLEWPARIKEANSDADVAVSCVIQRRNFRQIVSIYRVAQEKGVDRVFFRVPDLHPGSFGRDDGAPARSVSAAVLEAEELEILNRQLTEVLDLDRTIGLLGQSTDQLRDKEQAFRDLLNGGDLAVDDRICDVPFTSLVVGARQQVSPCFYLPMSQPVQSSTEVADLPVLRETQLKLLTSPDFRVDHCRTCHQFDGHKA